MTYIKALLETAVFLGVAAAIAPLQPKIRKIVLFAFALVFLSIMLRAEGGEDFLEKLLPQISEEDIQADGLEAVYKEGTEEGLVIDLCQRFSLDKNNVKATVLLQQEDNTIRVSFVRVFLYGTNVFKDIPSLVRYIEETYQTECEVILNDGKE
ncbi:MAG: hypothetical protein J6K61_05470 [Clostridia bacterium]|nr:hypothetical protein [Clostridia bacterium]